jgi:hypothetical protein
MNCEYRGFETGKLLGWGSVGGSRRATPLQVQGEPGIIRKMLLGLGPWKFGGELRSSKFELRTVLKNGNIDEVETSVTRHIFE